MGFRSSTATPERRKLYGVGHNTGRSIANATERLTSNTAFCNLILKSFLIHS